MGTGKEQAELWGPGARDWSDYNEPMCAPFYEAVLDETEVGPGTTLLDVGCGGGFAMLLAARRVPPYRESTRPRPCSISCASASPMPPSPLRTSKTRYPSMRASRKPDGNYRQENLFRCLVART